MKKYSPLILLVALASSVAFLSACEPPYEGEIVTYYARSWEGWADEWLDEKAKEFNDLDLGIRVNVKHFDDSTYFDAVTSARENNRAPDIYLATYSQVLNEGVYGGYCEPIEGLISEEVIADINESIIPMISSKGKIYAYPILTELGTMLYYRKSMLTAAGVTKAPATWADMLTACAKIKPTLKKGQYCLGLCKDTSTGWTNWAVEYNTSGHLALNDRWDTCLVDCPEYREIAGYYWDLYKDGYCPDGNLASYSGMIDPLATDKAAMVITGSWAIGTIVNDYVDIMDDIGVTQIATKTGSTELCTSTIGGFTAMISSTSKHKEAAAKVIEYLHATPEVAGTYFEKGGFCKGMPSNAVAAWAAEHVTDQYQKFYDAVTQVSEHAIPEPRFSWEITGHLSIYYQTVMTNSKKTLKTKEEYIEAAMTNCLKSINTTMSAPTYETNPELD